MAPCRSPQRIAGFHLTCPFIFLSHTEPLNSPPSLPAFSLPPASNFHIVALSCARSYLPMWSARCWQVSFSTPGSGPSDQLKSRHWISLCNSPNIPQMGKFYFSPGGSGWVLTTSLFPCKLPQMVITDFVLPADLKRLTQTTIDWVQDGLHTGCKDAESSSYSDQILSYYPIMMVMTFDLSLVRRSCNLHLLICRCTTLYDTNFDVLLHCSFTRLKGTKVSSWENLQWLRAWGRNPTNTFGSDTFCRPSLIKQAEQILCIICIIIQIWKSISSLSLFLTTRYFTAVWTVLFPE